jgi:hypothetical protein
MAYEHFLRQYGCEKQPVTKAFDIAILYDLTENEIKHLVANSTLFDEPNEAFEYWHLALLLFNQTKDININLYERCKAERRMRQVWKKFYEHCSYDLPQVPPLPED